VHALDKSLNIHISDHPEVHTLFFVPISEFFHDFPVTYFSGAYLKKQFVNLCVYDNNYALITFGIAPFLIVFLPFFFAVTPADAEKAGLELRPLDRLLMLSIIIFNMLLIGVALYVWENHWGGHHDIQGRYFLPLLPFLTIVFTTRISSPWDNRYAFLQLILSCSIIAILFVSILPPA
jgi:uncharacterized membrane protein